MAHPSTSSRPVKRQRKLEPAAGSPSAAVQVDTLGNARESEYVKANNVEEPVIVEDEDNVEEETMSSPTSHYVNINDLGFEILDHIFSYFSNPGGNKNSHYENQQNLLSFCQVNNAFYRVARLHLSRNIPIASTFKARQLLTLNEQSLIDSPLDSFGSRVHALLLLWPDQGKYSTRRTSVITESEFHSLLLNFQSLRNLELICLPYTRLDSLIKTKFASIGTLDNIRSLSFTNSPFLLSQREEYSVINDLLGLVDRLEHLSIINIPLNSVETTLDVAKPSYRLKTLTIKISSSRIIEPKVLEWLLDSTIQAGTCQELTIWLSKKCTDRYNEFNPSILSVKENEGFKGIEEPLSKLSPSLRKLSLMGLRTGQASTIISKTSSKLKSIQLYDTFGFGNDLLNDFPLPSGLERLEMLPNPSPAFGAPIPEEPIRAIVTNARNRNQAGSAANGPPTGLYNPLQRTTGRQVSTSTATTSTTAVTSTTSLIPNGNTSTSTNQHNRHDEEESTPSTNVAHTFTEIPISSNSFIQELGKSNRLEALKLIRIPDNARFGKRGKWNNKELSKACRRFGVSIEEISTEIKTD